MKRNRVEERESGREREGGSGGKRDRSGVGEGGWKRERAAEGDRDREIERERAG